MKANGGYSTLAHIYKEVLKVPNVIWNTKTPFKSVNRIVQTHKEFFRIRPGLWGLEEFRNRIPADVIGLDEQKDNKILNEYGHSYYQGLLVEIGNWEKYLTFVPAQDTGRMYLNTKLGDITTLTHIPQFTYQGLVKRARTIDVIWFNNKQMAMPIRMYEVEHTTDIQNSLLKFTDLQDFNIKFHIVANSVRKEEFERKRKYQGFKEIQDRLKFLSYENLAELHTKTAEYVTVKEKIDS
ncbi:MAG: hypothetical protein GC179_29855 [Anaerolineaceae bacterium]|nr:hypothetical protein [Anaerolineaceae bacterium]